MMHNVSAGEMEGVTRILLGDVLQSLRLVGV
jgi:hypothetical protein